MKNRAFYCMFLSFILVFSGCNAAKEPKRSAQNPPVNSAATIKSVEEINENSSKVAFKSNILGKDMHFNVYLPTGYNPDTRYPVLYMFHGYSGDENTWFPWLKMDRKAEELIAQGRIHPVIIVAPDMENSYGINSSDKYSTWGGTSRSSNLAQGRFEDYLYQELIPMIDANYSTDPTRESRYIGGLSMGGFVALHAAFKHPDLFSKVGGHSPALFLDDFPRGLDQWLFPSKQIREERDPLFLAERKDLSDLSVYLDCGDEDSYRFYEGCEKLYEILQLKNVRSQYYLNAGKHDGDYWSSHVEHYLLFYAGKDQ